MSDPFSEKGFDEPAEHVPTQKSRWQRNTFMVFSGLLVLIAGAVAIYGLNLGRTFDTNRTVIDSVFPEETLRPPAPEPESDAAKAQNVLLLGSDSHGEISEDIDEVTGSRADVIMVMHIPSNRENVQIMSIMRDNWVPIPEHGENKINAALAFGGVPSMVETVEKFVDVRIDHVAVIDFEGFKGLTDALGGVTVTSDHGFSTPGRTFVAGPQDLDGEAALSFVRERKSFSDGDYQRARNQQAYLRGVINTILSKDTLTDPGKISDSVSAIAPFLTVDEGLNSAYAAKTGFSMRELRGADVRFFTSPTSGTGMIGSQSVVHPDWAAIQALREHFRNDTVDEFEPTGR